MAVTEAGDRNAVAAPARAIKLDPRDNVAALLESVAQDGPVAIVAAGRPGETQIMSAMTAIPAGHKIALDAIAIGADVTRYGYTIGTASADIRPGEHVHSHNLRSRLSPQDKAASPPRVTRDAVWVRGLVANIAVQSGASPQAAADMADALTEAHLRGVETHGLRRLRPYIQRIRSGGVDGGAFPIVTGDFAALSVDGRNGIGHHVAAQAARAVSEAARRFGIGIAAVRASNHFGFAGHYAALIAGQGQVGLVMSNGQVCVGPAGAKRAILSNNPIAIAAPLPDGNEMIELDLAMSATSRAHIVEAAKAGRMIPDSWAQDDDGNPTQDASSALAGSLIAFGGERGFALLFAMEAMTGLLSGGAYADKVSSKEAAPDAPEGTSHTLIAIDPAMLGGADAYRHRAADLVTRLTGLPMKDGVPPPRYPGQRRWALRRERLANGIPLTHNDEADLVALAAECGIAAEPA